MEITLDIKKERLINTLNKRNFNYRLECIEMLSDVGYDLDKSYELLNKIKFINTKPINYINDNRIIKYIKTFEHVCLLLNIDINKFNEKYKYLTKSEIAQYKLLLINKVFNEDWLEDYNNSNQYKYTPYFIFKNGSFSYNDYGNWFGVSCVGFGWGFKNKELCEYVGKQFIEIYNDWLMRDNVIDGIIKDCTIQ